jgi:hypothetical protein
LAFAVAAVAPLLTPPEVLGLDPLPDAVIYQ